MRKAFQRKVLETLANISPRPSQSCYQERKLIWLTYCSFSWDSARTPVITIQSQDNEWNLAMRGAEINQVNALIALNGLVPGSPYEHQPSRPCPDFLTGKIPPISHLTGPHRAGQEPVYVTRLQHFHSIFLDLFEFIFLKKFFQHGSKSKLHKKVHGAV